MHSSSSFDSGAGGSNPYAPSQSNPSSFNFKNSVDSVRDVLGRWGKKVGEATKKAEDLAGNTWQHLYKTCKLGTLKSHMLQQLFLVLKRKNLSGE